MDQQVWTRVDDYLVDRLLPADEVMDAVLDASRAAGLPAIHVSAAQGALLMLLARIHGARRILEVGTLGGYSTVWLARGLPPDGALVTIEADPHHAEVARGNVARAGFGEVVDVRLGRGVEVLSELAAQDAGPFDLVFIDADKPSNPDYFRWALRLGRPGTVIIVDNVVRGGAVVEEARAGDASVRGVRALMDLIATEPRVTATAIQTVGAKGYDGFALALVVS